MADDKNADRSSIEIKTLLRKLHPDRGNHKERVRRLSKFRSYVMGDAVRFMAEHGDDVHTQKRGPPEFYDDDIPLLLLGSAAPAAYLDPDDETLVGLYGLLQACGTPSGEHDGRLKRSARHAMNLLKWLLIDWKNPAQKKDELNEFAESFLSLPASYYQHMNLDLHCSGDDRGGAMEDACEIIVLILTKHLKEDGEGQQPVVIEEVLSNPKAQQEFELWSARNTPASLQDVIKKNATARQSELAFQQRQEALAAKVAGVADEDHEESEQNDSEQADEPPPDDDDIVAALRKRKKDISRQLKEAEGRGEINVAAGVATRWEDSQLAREQAARAASAARAGQHETVRDSQEAAMEFAEREEEKAKVYSKDPLGIINTEDFDVRAIEKSQAEQMEQALHELQEQDQKAESTGDEDAMRKILTQKESVEALIDRMGGIEAMENTSHLPYSIIPTSPKFEPVLFLSLVHRNTPYDALIDSLDRLSSKTENQVEQLQNLVRDNFPLFVRCAEGFEEFRRSAESELGMGVNERIDKLEGIAESAVFQAQKSFKPLLDNTSEVRKVQSAMSVLQRVSPILEVPSLMRQHLDNRRYSEALKIYRRVMTIDEKVKIELLLHVKAQAEECVRDARRALERRLAQEKTPVDDLLDGIRDLGELQELEVPAMSKADNLKGDSEEDAGVSQGIYEIGGSLIRVRHHPPALACLLLQSAHFTRNVMQLIEETDISTTRIFMGETLADSNVISDDLESFSPKAGKATGNQWKYDILDSRVISTIKAVSMVRSWLPRLVKVARAAREDEKFKALRLGAAMKRGNQTTVLDNDTLSAFEVFIGNVTPSLFKLIEHVAFCALGSNNRTGQKDVEMTFGEHTDDKLKALLRSPLPPSQCTKVGKELAELVEIISENSGGANSLQIEGDNASYVNLSPLDESNTLIESTLITIERRRCIYAFDVCARACANRASGSGKLDADALLSCLQNLSEQLSRPEECSNEVERGCELVIRRCCEGLASYVRDRDDFARLSAVAECANFIANGVLDVVHEASFLSPNADTVREVILEDVQGLESAMFDEYLESIGQSFANSVRLDWLDSDTGNVSLDETQASMSPTFPAYLSASLLAIVRSRAQVEQALGHKIRQSENTTYQRLALCTVADGVAEGICNEVTKRKLKLKVRQADRLANELEFLRNTLQRYLGEPMKATLDSTLHLVRTKAGRGRDYQRDGPDGLAALEELERLGRVYVLCLGE